MHCLSSFHTFPSTLGRTRKSTSKFVLNTFRSVHLNPLSHLVLWNLRSTHFPSLIQMEPGQLPAFVPTWICQYPIMLHARNVRHSTRRHRTLAIRPWLGVTGPKVEVRASAAPKAWIRFLCKMIVITCIPLLMTKIFRVVMIKRERRYKELIINI